MGGWEGSVKGCRDLLLEKRMDIYLSPLWERSPAGRVRGFGKLSLHPCVSGDSLLSKNFVLDACLLFQHFGLYSLWIPAYAGMTSKYSSTAALLLPLPPRREVKAFNAHPLEIIERKMPKNSSLDNLKNQIQEAKKQLKLTTSQKGIAPKATGKFFNVGTELVSGVFVGVGAGLLFDWILGTSPWGLIVFFILGSIAGIVNVYKALKGSFKRKNSNS